MAITLIQLLQTMVQNKGSDLHLAAKSQPMMRVRGEMVKFDVPAFTPQEVEAMLAQIMNEHQKKEFAVQKSVDFAFKASGVGIFRVNAFMQRNGISVVMRVLTEAPPNIDDLKLPEICKKVCSYANGLVIVTGPTGSGKSTTLASMLDYINRTEKGHILTLEDPIEFQHETKLCMMNQRSLGQHFVSFTDALKAALREDPDVILIGEMRDAETVELALKAAETGHLVFATLHTNSAAKSIDRIINTFAPEQQAQVRTVLSETCRAVISQKLVPTADKKRRVCIHDIFVNTPAAANLIREGKTFQLLTVQQTGKAEGMQVLDQVLMGYVQSGEVDGQVAWEHANDKAMFAKWAPKEYTSAPTGLAAPGNGPSPTGTSGTMKKAG